MTRPHGHDDDNGVAGDADAPRGGVDTLAAGSDRVAGNGPKVDASATGDAVGARALTDHPVTSQRTANTAGGVAPLSRTGPRKGPALFLERTNYRQRRLRDTLRMMPVLGIVLFMIPLLWRQNEAGLGTASDAVPHQAGGGTADAVTFVFVGWALLIVATALIARRMRPDPADPAAGVDRNGDPA